MLFFNNKYPQHQLIQSIFLFIFSFPNAGFTFRTNTYKYSQASFLIDEQLRNIEDDIDNFFFKRSEYEQGQRSTTMSPIALSWKDFTFSKLIENPPTSTPKSIEEEDDGSLINIPGEPGIDYPVYKEIPYTEFDCLKQRYKGFFADIQTQCQAWHYCDFSDGQSSFLCPNGTLFSQVLLTCDWWFNVDCYQSQQLYVLNERLYRLVKAPKPKFPEDFYGPNVDLWLKNQILPKFRKSEFTKKSNSPKFYK